MICDCGHEASSYAIRPTRMGMRTCCRQCAHPPVRSVANPYAGLTLDHATNEQGNPVRVDSLRQMREAEKRFKFKSLVANERSSDFDKPPQTRVPDLFEQTSAAGNWLYPELAEQQIRELREAGEIA